MSIEYITSDLHFGHKRIYDYECKFSNTRKHLKSIDNMKEYLIESHNSTVDVNDIVYHLGDFSLDLNKEEAFEILTKLNGQIHFIKGNHDDSDLLKYINKNNYELSNGFPKFIVHEVGVIVKRNKKIYYLTHYPLQLGGRNGLRSLCGHIHENAADFPYSLNVGIDSPELPEGHPFGVPLTLEKACELLEEKFNKLIVDK